MSGDGRHPPALAIVQQLDAVDTARESGPEGSVARFVCAEGLRDVAELLERARDLNLVKILCEDGRRVGDVLIDSHDLAVAAAVRVLACTYKPGVRHEQISVARPVTFARRPRDHVIKCKDDGVDALHVSVARAGHLCHSFSKKIEGGLLSRPD